MRAFVFVGGGSAAPASAVDGLRRGEPSGDANPLGFADIIFNIELAAGRVRPIGGQGTARSTCRVPTS